MKKIAIALAAILVILAGSAWIAVRVLLAPERVRAMIESQASAALGEQVRIGSASARIFPTVGLDLRHVTIANSATTLDTVSLETGLRPLFSRRVENARITVSDGRVEIPWLIALLSAIAQAPPAPPGSGGGVTLVSIRTIELRDVSLTAGKHELRVDADGLYQEDRLEISRLDASGDATRFTARGALESVSRVVGSLRIDADTVNLDALLALAGAAAPPGNSNAARAPGAGAANGLTIDADIRARNGRGAAIAFSDLATHLHLTSSRVRLQPLSLNAFDGSFAGRIEIDTAARVPRIALSGDATALDMAALSAFVGSPGAISGRLSGTSAVTCTCADLAAARRGMRGDGRFGIVDGAIPGLQMVRTVILAFGRPASDAPPASGERFSRLGASFSVADGTIATRDLTLASPDFDLHGEGTVSALSGAIDFKANVLLSPELSRQAGRDLVRYAHEGDRVILPATLSGTVASPRVFINLQDALGRALKNELERRGRSILDRLLKRKPGG